MYIDCMHDLVYNIIGIKITTKIMNKPGDGADDLKEGNALDRLKQRLIEAGEDMDTLKKFEDVIETHYKKVCFTPLQRTLNRVHVYGMCERELKTPEGRSYILGLYDAMPLASVPVGRDASYYASVFNGVLFADGGDLDPDSLQLAEKLLLYVQRIDMGAFASMSLELKNYRTRGLLTRYALSDDVYAAESSWEQAKVLLGSLSQKRRDEMQDFVTRAQEFRRSKGKEVLE